MALEAETVLRPLFLAADGGGDGEVTGREAAPVFLATAEKDRPVDPMIWGDEKRMKRELLVWAKAVAFMAACSNNTSSSPSRSTRRRGCYCPESGPGFYGSSACSNRAL
ncbi:unnamed protein product [Miscanthus lutarioriparius]|uniref:Uncharacterized protein n=1 Tax=Miscanthus lutarioriparius TaxID=422564 RepID=A0A811SFR0_9POAL|nr:unnamed protein product [Miscanthus lutarioriparius]